MAERHRCYFVRLIGAGRDGVLAYVEVAGLDQDGVLDDGVRVVAGAEALVPILLQVLGA